MPAEIIGNTLTPKVLISLEKLYEVAIKFTPEKMTELGKKIESELNGRYGTKGLESDYGGNRFRFEAEKLRCRSHDCGNTYCEGLEEIYYVS